jgi:hypothetical protein
MKKGDIAYTLIPLYHKRKRGLFKYREVEIRGFQYDSDGLISKVSIRPTDRTHKWAITVRPTELLFDKLRADYYNLFVDIELGDNPILL